MTNLDPIVIVGSARTPLGDLLGVFASLGAVDLGAIAIKAALDRAKIPNNEIDEVIMGCVLTAGQGQAPARQAAIHAGISKSTPCSTINKVCGSGMKSIMLAHDLLTLNGNKIMVAGGMESMSNAPFLLEKARSGYRLGHAHLKDAMLQDGLDDAYQGTAMGMYAELTAEKYHLSRADQDAFATISLQRAQEATKNKVFLSPYEITPVTIQPHKGDAFTVTQDEHPLNVKIEKIPHLKPSFKMDGTITPANSSAISDGAAALVLMRLSDAKRRGLTPIAKILAHSSFSHDPQWFTTAPVGALQSLFKQLNWESSTPDLYEINEAFACVSMVAMQELNLPHEKVNVLGGACALGHPIGASGTRIICTLLSALQQQNKTLGVATVCIGGGEATAIAIERM